MAAKPIPDGYHTVTPYLVVPDVAAELDFLERAFGAEVTFKMQGPDGSVSHAEARVGTSMVMLGGSSDKWTPMPCMLYLYVEDVDAAYARAVAAGGESIMEPADQFYGDRNGGVRDAFGNQWWVGTHVEDLTPEEMRRRAEAAGK
jgi:uncharacterized glyoxalase superfamily protein PhnB